VGQNLADGADGGMSGSGTGFVWYIEVGGMTGVEGGVLHSAARLCVELYMVLKGSGLGRQINIGDG